MSVSEDDTSSKIFVCLKHPIRRRILSILFNGPRSFSDLQSELRIESPHMSYHIDCLGNLLCRTEDGKYALSHLGETAFSMMKDVEEPQITHDSLPRAVKKNPRKYLKLGKFSVPFWPFAVLIVSMISSAALGYYLWTTFTIPLEIREPIEIVGYPSQWSLYPGEIAQFNVTVRNHASLNYSVVLDFRASDVIYQQSYITFSDETYTVVPGEQNLESWLNVTADAPPANLNVTVAVLRVTDRRNGSSAGIIFSDDFEGYSAGAFPYTGEWELWFDGMGSQYQVVVDSVSNSPTKSLQLLGYHNHLAACAAKSFVTNAFKIGFEVSIRVDEIPGGVGDVDIARVGFCELVPPYHARWWSPVLFLNNGSISIGGERNWPILQSYVADRWYRVKLIVNRSSDTYSVWIDDALKGENLPVTTSFGVGDITDNPSSKIAAFSVGQNYDSVKAYYDDVKIFSE